MKKTFLALGCLAALVFTVVTFAQSGPPPFSNAELPAPGFASAPQPGVPVAIPTRETRSSNPITGFQPADGPFAPAGSVGHDNVIANTQASIAVRTTTAWLAGPTTKAGEAQANALGSTFTIPLFAQEGRITETVMGTFLWEGKAHQIIMDQQVKATLYRFYRLDGTNLVLLPEVVTNKVNNLP